MVRKARVWFDGELAWNPAEMEEGGIAVQTQTAVLHTLSAGEILPESLPIEEEVEGEAETEPAPVSPRTPAKERRHLAGANWLDDWTLYFPASPNKPRTPKPKTTREQ